MKSRISGHRSETVTGIERLRQAFPWWGRVTAKIVLSRLPARYALWQSLGVFRHGRMDDADYAISVFEQHVSRAGLSGKLNGTVILELGPGDSVASAIIAAAHGARAFLVDSGRFAKNSPSVYQELVGRLQASGLHPPDIADCMTLEDLLTACRAVYCTDGLRSLEEIESGSIDLIYSHAVMEHVRREEFLPTQRECARLLRPGGLCSHQVDLRDHLGGGLNNLRFRRSVWESPFFVRSGFYTNRIQFDAMLEIFEQAGFRVRVGNVERWSELPIRRDQLAAEFRSVPESVLLVSAFDALLEPREK